jgi:hypothetical protein
MKFSLWTNYGARNSAPVFAAFADSLKAAGHEVVYNQQGADRDVIWSVLWRGRMQSNRQIFKPGHTIVLEVGGLKRNETWKVAIGGINREAYFGPMGNNSDRAEKLGLTLKPWKPNPDGPIVLCCQNPFSRQWEGQPGMVDWTRETLTLIRKHTDRHILLRPHPRHKLPPLERGFLPNVTRQEPRHLPGTYDDFDFEPVDAWSIINWSSNPATQAVMDGIPVFVGDDSLAYDVGNTDLPQIENPQMPDRTQWLNDIAYTEWTLEEIAQGLPLQRLTDQL